MDLYDSRSIGAGYNLALADSRAVGFSNNGLWDSRQAGISTAKEITDSRCIGHSSVTTEAIEFLGFG